MLMILPPASGSPRDLNPWNNGLMSMAGQEPGNQVDQLVDVFHRIDEKVNTMRSSIESDPETLMDKVVKFALPSIAGLVAGKLFQSFWSRLVRKRNGGVDTEEGSQESATAGLLFAVLSAAVTTLASNLIGRGSQTLIDRRHK